MKQHTGPIAITGADGHVGTHLRARMQGLPNELRPLGREDDLASAFADAHAVILLAGTLAPIGRNTYEAANVETVRRAVAALSGSTVKRLVFLSYSGADPTSSNRYLRTKGEAEHLIHACGCPAVVVRSTFIYGPPADPGPSATPFMVGSGKAVSVIGTGRQHYAPVYVEDVVEALVRFALDSEAPTGTFALAGPDTLTVDEFVDALNGADLKERHLGRHAARVLARVVPKLTPAMVDVLAADSLPDDSPLAASALSLNLTHLVDNYPYASRT
jgi:uncharacterized protein YbjT (DUF2867 family)